MTDYADIRGILFDAGDTLYGPIGGRWNPRFDFEEVILRHHPEVESDRFPAAFAVGQQFMDRAPTTPARDDYHRAILGALDVADPSASLLEELDRPVDRRVVEVFPDVLPGLKALRDLGMRMAVVSDNWGDLEKSFADLGLDGFFDVFVVSEAMGCRKPDPRMYRAGSDGLGLSAAECLFIDDDPHLVLAAVKLGYRGFAIDRYGRCSESAEVGWITGMDELLPLVQPRSTS